MQKNFVQVHSQDFVVNGEKIVFRGFGLGSWMNLEHFMIGLPGTDSLIKKTFSEVYGEEKSSLFFDKFLMEFVDEDDFKFLKDLGVNLLRIPFSYKFFLDDQYPDSFKTEGFKYLDHIISLCEKHEIYAILDLHTTPGGQNPDWHCDTASGIPMLWNYGALRDTVIALWGHIAKYYRNNPWVAGYDIVNEPSMVKNAVVFNEFYDKVVSEIRKHDTNHIIFIEGNRFSTDFSMLDPVEDPQVAYTFHFYPFVDEPAVLSPEMKREDRKKIFLTEFERLVSIRDKYNRPVWCGEFGLVLDEESIQLQTEIIKDMLDLCESYDVSWTLWTYKDAACMGIVYPLEDTPWIKLTTKIREEWNQHEEQAKGEQLVDHMAETYFKPISADLRYELQFRMRTIMQVICVEQHLKPFLQLMPWEEAYRLPESFHFNNCTSWDELSLLIKKYTQKA